MFSTELSQKQDFAVEFFSKTLEKSRLANAYLFTGNAPEDKLKLAKELNQILNCQSNQKLSAPCKSCTNCKWIEEGTHPMTPVYLAPSEDSKKAIIKIEQVQELQKELSKASNYYRLVIIPEASYSCLTKHSANALLKVLEEPNSHILFLLFSDDKENVLPTISSRTQVLPFKANPKSKFSEEAYDLVQKYSQELSSIKSKSRLEIISMAERLAEHENKQIIEILEIQQAQSENPDEILAIERAKSDLKSFIRPKNALEQMLLSMK